MLVALPIWTLLVWATRIRNIMEQDGSAAELVVPSVLTVLAVVALLDRRRGLWALVVATVAVWGVRLPMVLVHDHSVPFKLVHAALAVISIGLALATVRRLGSPASPTRRRSARA
jgi:hypothetical protein